MQEEKESVKEKEQVVCVNCQAAISSKDVIAKRRCPSCWHDVAKLAIR